MSSQIAYKNFGARKSSFLHHIQVVAIIALPDNVLSSLLRDAVHSIQDNVKLSGIQSAEHKGLVKTVFQCFLDIVSLGVHWGLEVLLLVPVTKCFR